MVFKTGRPNKQQRGQIERQRATWIKERNKAARNAIEELEGEHNAIQDYGLEGYFKNSIVKLKELLDGEDSNVASP